MHLNYKEIHNLINELIRSFDRERCTVVKAKKVFHDELFLHLRAGKKNIPLLFKISSQFCFLCQGTSLVKAPQKPFLFSLLLKKYIINNIIGEIKIIPGERIFSIIFPDCALIFEMLGRNGNVFLLDTEGRIIGSLIKRKSDFRDEKAGALYVEFPQSDEKKDFHIREKYDSLRKCSMEYRKEALEIINNKVNQENIRAAQKTEKFYQKIKREYQQTLDDEQLNRFGKLLLTYAYDPAVKIGDGSVSLTDYETGAPVVIPLLKKSSLLENAKLYFEKSKEKKKKRDELKKVLDETEAKLKAMLKKRIALDPKFEGFNQLYASEFSFKHSQYQEEKSTGLPYLTFLLASGKKVLVGRSSRHNLELLRKYARGEDYWFHIRDFPGSYVIIKMEKNTKNLEPSDISEASLLALYFSKARNTGKADIIYTKCKYLKILSKKTGKVIYRGDKNFYAQMDEEKIKEIKRRF